MMEISVDCKEYSIHISQLSKRLASATDDQKQNYILSPSGYGMHWSDIDEDLSIDGIIGITHDAPVFSSRISREGHCMAGV